MDTPPKVKVKTPKRMQKFRAEYTAQFKCIIPVYKDEHRAKCTICICEFGIGHGGGNDIKNHFKSMRHQSAAAGTPVPKISDMFS